MLTLRILPVFYIDTHVILYGISGPKHSDDQMTFALEAGREKGRPGVQPHVIDV